MEKITKTELIKKYGNLEVQAVKVYMIKDKELIEVFIYGFD